jgi:type IV secretory pathway VirB2 component (pilin)
MKGKSMNHQATQVSHAKQAGRALLLALVALVGIYLVDAEFFNHALAQSDVFAKGEEKGNEIAELLAGKIAITITGLAIAICGVLMQMGRLSHMVGIRIIVGAFIISAAMDIAAFLYA